MTYDLKSLFWYAARYNARANREMSASLAKLTGRARRRDVGSWFGSIHGLLNHIIDTLGLPNNWGNNAAYLKGSGV